MKLLVLLTGLMLSVGAHAQSGGKVLVQRQFECASNNNKYAECYTGLDKTQNIYLSQQISKSACIQGQSFNIFDDKVSVSRGCRAVFVARGLTNNPQPGDQVIEQIVALKMKCESQDMKTTRCRIPLKRVRQVYIEQQHSKAACVQGQSYFVNDRFITVSRGCRATFVVRGIQ